MMKLAAPVLSLFLVLSSSQASTTVNMPAPAYHKRLISNNQTQTKSVLARAVPKTKRQVLILTNLLDAEDSNNLPGSEELDIYVGYRRPEIVTVPATDSDLVGDYIAVRLAVIRARAMAAYRQKNCIA